MFHRSNRTSTYSFVVSGLALLATLASCSGGESPGPSVAGDAGSVGGASSSATVGSEGATTTSSVTTGGLATTGTMSSTGGMASTVSTVTDGSTTTTTTTTTSQSTGQASTSTSMGGTTASSAGGGASTSMGGSDSTTSPAGGAGGAGTTGGSTDFQPCPAAGPCKVLPLGDSITVGLGFDGGYRVELFHLALSDGHDITFTGTQAPNGPSMVDGVTFPRNHEGISGETIQQIDNRVPSPGLNEMPHIILVHAGTNDMAGSSSGADMRLGALMDDLIAEAPDALIVIGNIIPLPFAAAAVDSFNATIPGMVEERANAGAHIVFAEQFEGFPESELGDGVHPNEQGYSRMAQRWYEVIEPYLP